MRMMARRMVNNNIQFKRNAHTCDGVSVRISLLAGLIWYYRYSNYGVHNVCVCAHINVYVYVEEKGSSLTVTSNGSMRAIIPLSRSLCCWTCKYVLTLDTKDSTESICTQTKSKWWRKEEKNVYVYVYIYGTDKNYYGQYTAFMMLKALLISNKFVLMVMNEMS